MTDPLDPGLYESLRITARLADRLSELSDRLVVDRSDLHRAEAANRIGLHLGRVLEQAIASLGESDRSQRGLEVTRELLQRLDELIDNIDAAQDAPVPTDPYFAPF